MQQPLRKTFNLAKEYPLLLAPLAASSWITFYLEWFQKAATHFMLHHWLMGHSVLGFSVPLAEPTHQYVRRGMMVLAPFETVLRVLIFSVTVAAFVLTARLARQLDQSQQFDWRGALVELRARLVRVVLVSAALLVVFALTAFLCSFLASLEIFASFRDHYSFRTTLCAMLMLCATVMAWLLTPAFLKLIADRWSDPIGPQQKLCSRLATIAVAFVLIAVQGYVTDWTPQINFALEDAQLLRTHIVWPLISCLMNLPLGLLWIYLAALQSKGPESVELSSPS